MEETVELYDTDRRPTGKMGIRYSKLPEGFRRYVVEVCIFSNDGRMLIQKRKNDKRFWPGRWSISAGGGVSPGESPREAAVRETKEELGVDIRLDGIPAALSVTSEEAFYDIFVIHSEVDLDKLILQEDEVTDASWASRSEVLCMIEDGTFVGFEKGLVEYIFEVAEKGLHIYS